MVLQHLKYQNKLSFTMLLVCISLLTACGSTKVNSNNTSEAHSGVDTENNVYSKKETEVATENEQDNTELGETFYTLGRREKPKILFAYDYSVNWKYIDIGEGTEYRQEKIEDRKGAEIIFWHYAEQFSQYYGGGYDLQTASVETVVLLSHKKPDSVINVKVEFGEGEGKIPLDNIEKRAESYKPKERVTYKMIKEYIEAKHGFKVHTAYIAEVKRDLGLPMYDAPNAVEELKQPRKHPTPEKVEAIKDALKHFEVI